MNPKSAYQKLLQRSKEVHLLETTAALVSWDTETKMPKDGIEHRSNQSAYLSGKSHQLQTAKSVGDWIEACEGGDFDPNSAEGLNVREWRYNYDRETKLPNKLVEEFEKAKVTAHSVWAEAREKSDFALFLPHLEKVVDFTRQKAECFGYEDEPYDALLESYERGAKTRDIAKLFDSLQPDLVEIVGEATSQKPRVDEQLLKGTYPELKQKEFNQRVAEGIGFDFNAGRIDTAVHPFCTTLGPRDVRLTTRYDKKDFTGSLYGVLHEAGHGMYEQGLPQDSLPTSKAVSLGIHESQSRLWENQIGRSQAFWKKWLPDAAKTFPRLKNVKPKQMHLAVNRAERSFIRVEADEVTYDLHIILRFRVERAMISGEVSIADIPAFWNETYKDLFGIEVDKDSNGCLQDVHWSFGLIGYFPTYSLGNINAAQLFDRAMQNSTIRDDVEKASYASLLDWLRKKIHVHGTRYMPKELIKRATGKLPQSRYLLEHLRNRYLR
ncbi:MAG: carboxypeptidase Taq [Verrucomicrobiales bacterium]|jgi:carboxypeptidase Taq